MSAIHPGPCFRVLAPPPEPDGNGINLLDFAAFLSISLFLDLESESSEPPTNAPPAVELQHTPTNGPCHATPLPTSQSHPELEDATAHLGDRMGDIDLDDLLEGFLDAGHPGHGESPAMLRPLVLGDSRTLMYANGQCAINRSVHASSPKRAHSEPLICVLTPKRSRASSAHPLDAASEAAPACATGREGDPDEASRHETEAGSSEVSAPTRCFDCGLSDCVCERDAAHTREHALKQPRLLERTCSARQNLNLPANPTEPCQPLSSRRRLCV